MVDNHRSVPRGPYRPYRGQVVPKGHIWQSRPPVPARGERHRSAILIGFIFLRL